MPAGLALAEQRLLSSRSCASVVCWENMYGTGRDILVRHMQVVDDDDVIYMTSF